MLKPFPRWSVPIPVHVITLDAVKAITDLPWLPVATLEDVPTGPGVYAWVDRTPPHGVHYTGSGSGVGGLRTRLRNQLRWRRNQVDRLATYKDDPTEDHAWLVAEEVPLVRTVAEDNLELYVAETSEAGATVSEVSWRGRNGEPAPQGALAWERFIFEASRALTGQRGPMGGSAWEGGETQLALAWDRIVALRGWPPQP